MKTTTVAAIISIDHALCRIGRNKTLSIDHFQISPGQHWCLFGGNGAGKTLFAKLLRAELVAGRTHVSYGKSFSVNRDIVTVSFEEQRRLWEREIRHDISEFNESALDQGTSVEELVVGSNSRDEQFTRKLDNLLGSLQLTALRDKGIRYLSSGQLRKVLIAKALVTDPVLLILDEPLESIDKNTQSKIREVIQDWMGVDNSTLLLSRRSSGILPGITHLAVMDDLTLIAKGELNPMLKCEEYLAVVNRPSRRVTRIPAATPGYLPQELNPDNPLIELNKVSASYQSTVVFENFSWKMHPGQHTSIEGPNGCGKSTLLSLIDAENHKAYGQDVILFGRRRGTGETVWDIKARFGVVSNELHNKYVKGWRVIEVVVSGFFDSVGLYDDSGASEEQSAKDWLRALGIEELGKCYYHELSFGQQRLILLARAMVKSPTVLILDEPCVGLDDYYRQLILNIVDLIATQTRTHIIYVSHSDDTLPVCINQRLRFVSNGDGGFLLNITSV